MICIQNKNTKRITTFSIAKNQKLPAQVSSASTFMSLLLLREFTVNTMIHTYTVFPKRVFSAVTTNKQSAYDSTTLDNYRG